MKIAMIGQKRVPSREGGIEVVVTELATRMAALGHQVDCLNRWEPSVQKQMKKVDTYQGVRLLRVRTLKADSLNAIVYAFHATLKALFHRYDVIHLHAEGPASMALFTHLFGVPTVVTIHGLDWQRAKWGGFATKFLRFGEKMAARYADALIVLSNGNKQYFHSTYGRESVLIPNGITVRPPLEPQEITRRWGLKKDGYILFVARIVPEKGLHYLLEAFSALETNKKLVIAGKINRENEYVASIVQSAAKDARVVTTDFVEGETLGELMSNASVYVLPSDIEGMSMSLLEALSYGRRCLLSDIAENKEAAGEHARYFEHGCVASLKKELEGLLAVPQTLEEAAATIAYVQERFNWDSIAQSTLALYQSIAKTDKKTRSSPL